MISPMIGFNGQARAAVQFYASVFDNQPDIYDGPDGHVAHAELEIFGSKLMLCDDPENSADDTKNFASMSLSINLTDKNQLQKLWDKLKDGATIHHPLGPTDWSLAWGTLTDRFGVPWQFNLD